VICTNTASGINESIIICGLPFFNVSGLREQVRNGFGSKLQV